MNERDMNERDMNEHDGANPKLDALIGALPRAIEPPRDLWPTVNARIALQRQAIGSRGNSLPPRCLRPSPSLRCSSASHTTRSRVCRHRCGLMSNSTARISRCAKRRSNVIAPAPTGSIRNCAKPSRRISPSSTVRSPKSELRSQVAPRDAALGQMLQRTYDQELAIVDAVTPRQMGVPDQSHYRGAL